MVLADLLGSSESSVSGWAAPVDDQVLELSRQALKSAANTFSDAELYDLQPQLCSTQKHCNYLDEGRILYLDEQHLSQDGARVALREFHIPTVGQSSKRE
jgi:hypothetical protein